jgi:hypothetical protein
VQPLLDHPPHIQPYQRGSWGPSAAQSLVRGHRRWQEAWLATSTKPNRPTLDTRAGRSIDQRGDTRCSWG